MKHTLNNEKEIHNYVQALKNFYGEFSSFVVVCGVCLFIWLLAGGGYFWPIWVILVWGIVLFLKASKLNIISDVYYDACHSFREKLPFIREEWQDEKIQELLKKAGLSAATSRSLVSKIALKAAPARKATKVRAKKKISAPKVKVSKVKKETKKKKTRG